MLARQFVQLFSIILVLAMGIACSCDQNSCEESKPVQFEGAYLGLQPSDDEPELFAPGFVTTDLATRDITFSPEGDEMFFGAFVGQYAHSAIVTSRMVDGVWTTPEVAPFATDPSFTYLEPQFSPDGNRLFFFSDRPGPNGEEGGNQDIWAVDRSEDGWGEAYNLGPPVSTEASEFFPSVTHDGTLYFTRQLPGERGNYIYRSRLVDGEYQEAERLPEQVNAAPAQYNAWVAPDESYIIVPMAGRPDSLGGTDYYVCFRSENDMWSEPIHMGDKVNSEDRFEYSPYVSPDGRFFFFMSARPVEPARALPEKMTIDWLVERKRSGRIGMPAIWWVDASFIEALRPE
jgi:hypothetical protein